MTFDEAIRLELQRLDDEHWIELAPEAAADIAQAIRRYFSLEWEVEKYRSEWSPAAERAWRKQIAEHAEALAGLMNRQWPTEDPALAQLPALSLHHFLRDDPLWMLEDRAAWVRRFERLAKSVTKEMPTSRPGGPESKHAESTLHAALIAIFLKYSEEYESRSDLIKDLSRYTAAMNLLSGADMPTGRESIRKLLAK